MRLRRRSLLLLLVDKIDLRPIPRSDTRLLGLRMENLPLVVMLDFLSEAALEQEVLAGAARVEAWNVQAESEIAWDKVIMAFYY